MNILNNQSKKEASILLNDVIYLGEKNNIHIDKSKLFKEFKERSLVISSNTLENTLHIYSKSDSDFSIKIDNTTVNDLKSARAVALLRYAVSSINSK